MTTLLIKLFVKDADNINSPKVREAYGSLGSFVGIICNIFLCAIKLTVGLTTGSISIAADALNNLSDMGSSVITMIGFKLAGKPADNDHPFGHGRMEYMSAFIVAVLILLVGFELLKSSVSSLFSGSLTPKYSIFAVVILGVSILIKLWLFIFNNRLGKKINSEALLATAKDSLNDCVTTLAILVSVAVSFFVDLPFNLDALMGLLVSLFILYSGIQAAKTTIDQILGAPPEKELIEKIEKGILTFDEFVGIHDLIVHNYGPGRQFASVHVEVPQDIDIVKCHEKVDLCEKQLSEQLGIVIVIHMDPIDTNDETVLQTKFRLTKELKKINSSLSLHDFRMTPVCDEITNLIFDVVVPKECNLTEKELEDKIRVIAKEVNPTFNCVITFDQDFT